MYLVGYVVAGFGEITVWYGRSDEWLSEFGLILTNICGIHISQAEFL
jgi:hypothetical protein